MGFSRKECSFHRQAWTWPPGGRAQKECSFHRQTWTWPRVGGPGRNIRFTGSGAWGPQGTFVPQPGRRPGPPGRGCPEGTFVPQAGSGEGSVGTEGAFWVHRLGTRLPGMEVSRTDRSFHVGRPRRWGYLASHDARRRGARRRVAGWGRHMNRSAEGGDDSHDCRSRRHAHRLSQGECEVLRVRQSHGEAGRRRGEPTDEPPNFST